MSSEKENKMNNWTKKDLKALQAVADGECYWSVRTAGPRTTKIGIQMATLNGLYAAGFIAPGDKHSVSSERSLILTASGIEALEKEGNRHAADDRKSS